MKKRVSLLLVLWLGLASLALALPQGTLFWDFESPGPNNDYWPAGWTRQPMTPQEGLVVGEYNPIPAPPIPYYHSATRSVKFVLGKNNYYIITPQLYFVAGEALNFSIWVYNAFTGNVKAHIAWGTSIGGPWTSLVDTQNLNQNSGWVQVQATYTAATSGNYYIRFWLENNGTGSGYLDDIMVTYNEGAILNVNSTGYLQPGTRIYRNTVDTGFNTDHSFSATSANIANLAGTYTPGPAPTGYHWVNPSITVNTSDFTLANGYVYTITFILEKDFTLNVYSTGYNQPGTEIYKNSVDTGYATNHTFTATTAAALAGSYTPGTAPTGYHWVTSPIAVSEGDFTAGNNYTYDITFVLEKDFTLNVYSTGYNQPGTEIYKNSVDTGYATNHTFTATTAAALAGSYTPGTAPTGYHWVKSSIVVSEGDFTAGNNYTYDITFELEKDFTLNVTSTGGSEPGTEIFKNGTSIGHTDATCGSDIQRKILLQF
ncbi:MAG TPA: hypothetical protein PLG20_06555, partial [Candidatus Syntrophosphaera sp.]|nr:hypothetical protein [Candidatus Syntrophosphaera sp.]